jgi:hypothetical protein
MIPLERKRIMRPPQGRNETSSVSLSTRVSKL